MQPEKTETRPSEDVTEQITHGDHRPKLVREQRTKSSHDQGHGGETAAPDVPPAAPRTAKLVVVVALVALLIAGGLSLLNRTMEGRALARETEKSSIPIVAVVHPTQEKPDEDLVLPGSLQAYEESPIYARTSGYLVKWYKDIGSRVEKGELLAKIDTPEVDQELLQARAARQQTAAQLDLAKSTAERWQNLRQSDSVSQQEADQQVSAFQQGRANLAASDANVRRLEQLESFKNVYAPFSGVLTKRNVDPGALISAGAAGKEMFDLAKVDPLRVFVSVPQAYAPNVRTGLKAWVTLQEYPGQKFEGVVAHTADAIDPATRNYELDLFGRVRRTVEAANAQLQSSAADLANSQLVLTSELAADYFTLRELDAEIDVVTQSADYQRKALRVVENRHNGGIASGLELAQQQTLLDSTVAQISLLQQQRAQFEHAIATLVGTPAPTFVLAAAPFNTAPPPVPLGVPTDILQRRPDVATAERTMAFQNAQVGIASTAFYPNIGLTGSGGVQSSAIGNLISAPSAVWSVGANMLQPIFNGGRNRADLTATNSAYDESVANYRQTVLTAFQQVADGLSGLQTLSQAAATQQAAVQDAQRALDIANNRYTGGVTTYLDVVTAESTLLANQRLATQLLGQRMITSVLLVKALGGGWDASQLNDQQVRPRAGQIVQP